MLKFLVSFQTLSDEDFEYEVLAQNSKQAQSMIKAKHYQKYTRSDQQIRPESIRVVGKKNEKS